jgi:DNA invertase Pin-like site-specific DNA recombinase
VTTTPTPGEHAIVIPRVSSTKQREEDQTPGLLAYAERMGYAVDEVVPVHGRSAFHGKHVKAILAAVETYVRHGSATVVIFRHVDRSSREGVFKGFDLLNKIMAAGARIEFSEQEFLNAQPGWIGPLFELAKEESKIKQDRSLQGNGVKRAKGELVGRVPWGYDPVLRDGTQVGIKPNALGREWIPKIFNEAVAGASTRQIADLIRPISSSPQKNNAWSENTIRRIIANTTYYGSMKNNPNMKFEPLIGVELYKKANAAFSSRVPRGRGTVKNEPVLARPICGHCYGEKRDGAPNGMSPMYRTTKFDGRYAYLTCRGSGAARKGCGAPAIPVEAFESTLDEAVKADTRPHLVPEYTAGDDSDEQRAVILEKIRVAAEAQDFALLGQLSQDAAKIGPSVRKSSMKMVDSGMTTGKYWETLDREGKREELLNRHVVAWLMPQGVVVLQGPRVP